ncbi:preprotein translocase subunit YajC [Kiritimatiellaeota bacterium B1221]|nr:preprotein translocase subunit YajC [Kiritimatiellaeota bacterium B1221]
MNPFSQFIAMAAPQGQNSQQSPFGFVGMMVLFFGIMYVMMIRPQQRKEKERKAMLAELKKGDKVLFAGGLIGTIFLINDKTATIKVSDNVRLDVARGAITALITDDADVSEATQA